MQARIVVTFPSRSLKIYEVKNDRKKIKERNKKKR